MRSEIRTGSHQISCVLSHLMTANQNQLKLYDFFSCGNQNKMFKNI